MTIPGNLLAIDTTFAAVSAAIRLANGTAAAKTFFDYAEMSSGHAECLMGMVDAVLEQAGIKFSDLNALVVTIGPGSFTGTRIGIAAVRGFALVTGLPVYTASSLAVIGRRVIVSLNAEVGEIERSSLLAVCVDARRDQIYFQMFSRSNQTPITEPKISSLDDIIEDISLQNKSVSIIASPTLDIAPVLKADGVCIVQGPSAVLPSAEYLLDVHLEAANPPKPLYLRPPDAKLQSGKAVARQPLV